MKLSVVILTKNEAEVIQDCLESIKDLADEIIVVDSGSTDDTTNIAQKFGAKIIAGAGDYAALRNLGLQAAVGDWIFYLDADERLSPPLVAIIKQTISHPQSDSYKFYRQNIIFGKWIKHGGYWPDPVHRLFQREALVKWTGPVHESPTVTGNIGIITIPILHYTVRSITAALEKSKTWSAIEAQLYFEAHAPQVTWWHIIKAFSSKLFSQLFLKGGILDGMPGIILAYIQAFHQASVMVNLWHLQDQQA